MSAYSTEGRGELFVAAINAWVLLVEILR